MAEDFKFPSFVMGGYECAYARPKDKDRMDLLAATLHDQWCAEDYDLILPVGIKAVREGLSWFQVDKGGGNYNFQRYEQMMRVAREKGIKQIWNLNHFDMPEDLDIFGDEFVPRFRNYAVACAKLILRYQEGTIFIAPINEMSFYTYMAGSYGSWHPFVVQRGLSFKKRLVEATIAAIEAIKAIDDDVRFIIIDPVMRRTAKDRSNPALVEMETAFKEGRFHTFDLVAGRSHPELGGKPEYLDIIGVNFYPSSQEWIVEEDPGDTASFETIDWQSGDWQPLDDLLNEVQERYHRPMVLSEIGAWGDLREGWWKMVLNQVEHALERGIDMRGICAYPLIDRPDWTDGHLTNSGIWDFREGDPGLIRVPHEASIALLTEFAKRHA